MIMPRLFVAGLIVSLAVALIAAAEHSTGAAEDRMSMENSSVEPGENTTDNLKHHHRPSRECGDHETWSKCGKACENTCKRSGVCIVKICGKDWDGCRCKLGYVRNRKGKCVRRRDCNMCNGSKKYSAPR